jgi:hypothetical protein
MLLATGAYAQATSDPATKPMKDPMLQHETPAATEAVPEAAQAETAQEPADTQPLPDTMAESPALQEGEMLVDVATVSADQLIGATIETTDGQPIAEVKDVILSENGEVQDIAAGFGGFLGLGGEEVLLTVDEVDFVKDQADTLIVRTNLTPEKFISRGRPSISAPRATLAMPVSPPSTRSPASSPNSTSQKTST